MDFALSEELLALQESVRRLSQDKVKPRAREIDESGEYPQDLFEIFRDAGLLGLCIPEEYGGSGAGILGLTIAIEEVAKYSNTAALMLLLTRLPGGPIMIAGSEDQKQRYLPGVAVGNLDHKMGVRGVDTGELLLDGVRVPAENVVGEIGGFRLAMLGLNAMRPIVAARGIGLAEGALMYATEYAEQREMFGKSEADMQGIQWEIAKLAVEIEAARLLTYRAASLADPGKFTKEWVPYLSMAKYHATGLAVKASGVALQLLGAAGYMKDHPTELWYRDAKQLTIVEGTSQVQLGLIAKGVLDRDLWWD